MTTTPARDPGELLREAARRAADLGWRTITVSRLTKLRLGDVSALPPDPATAPPSAFGTYRPRRMAAAARPDVDFSEVIARCPEHGTRTETYPECRCPDSRPDNTTAPQPCPPGCVACATDESHDPARPDNTGA